MLLTFNENIPINTFLVNRKLIENAKVLNNETSIMCYCAVFSLKNEKFIFKCFIDEENKQKNISCNLSEEYILKLKKFKLVFQNIDLNNNSTNKCVFNYFGEHPLSTEFILELKTKLLHSVIEKEKHFFISSSDYISLISSEYAYIAESTKIILLSTSFNKQIKEITSNRKPDLLIEFDMKTFSVEKFTSILLE